MSAIVIGVIYIIMTMALSAFATWLEKRSRRSRKTTARPDSRRRARWRACRRAARLWTELVA